MFINQILTKLKSLVYSKSETDSLLNGKASSSHTHTKSQITDFPTIPTVNNATLKIQKNGTDVKTFTANASSDVTCNITVPTKVSELSNDSGFLTSHQSLSNYSTLANTVKSLSISGKTITVTPGSGSAYTLTTQDTTYSHPTSSGNKHIPSGGSSGQFLGWSADGTAKWVNNPNTNTWTAMVGATSSANGSVGYVNAVPPKDGYNTKYLRADGTWQVPPDHTYTVNNATLTIQKNGSNVATFTANASSNATANITVPTKVSQLTNDSGFLTSHQSLSNYSTLANTVKSLSISGKTITVTPGSGKAYTLTTQDTNTTYSNFVKSGSGAKAGLVPAPSTTAGTTKYLREDGTWQVPPDHTYTVNNATLTIQKNGTTVKTFTANASSNVTCNITVPTKTSELTNNSGFLTSHQSLSGYVPRSGGSVMTGSTLGRNVDTDRFDIFGGTGWFKGGLIVLTGASYNDDGSYTNAGVVKFVPGRNSSITRDMWLFPNGTWLWNGTAVQIASDQRLKQQISNIDDKLLDAWEDVLPCQFKYNDAVDQKGDTARLHTGYVVQQIDEACKSHNLDISAYGLYCHEEYPEETEEVEVEQEDGTKTKERKVIREANEHYSLRYTETLVVECAYLRRENSRLKENLASIEERLEKLEKAENS